MPEQIVAARVFEREIRELELDLPGFEACVLSRLENVDVSEWLVVALLLVDTLRVVAGLPG